ncbi:peroxiredoxin [Exilibacterium tricleocarpae]|uniref:Peroxiredoxin n=1 Tax=Exilibacterium tricleocarpae TaxID=2591008 RepID=A0A545SMY1_9GAMM|nr:peroxidase family protein [Exilibacterium tricleocarpae]TQV66317.1 peroxiredoxin [Exilibacterium tricleocarpae]
MKKVFWFCVLLGFSFSQASLGSAELDIEGYEFFDEKAFDSRSFSNLNLFEVTSEYRTFNGSFNNLSNPSAGAIDSDLKRLAPNTYGDGVSSMAGATLSSPRIISNYVMNEDTVRENRRRASAFLWQWGQFIDHDLDLTPADESGESAPVFIPLGDLAFDPLNTGNVQISFSRSLFNEQTGTGAGNPREQINSITAWVDASSVYGSTAARAFALRTLDGTGRLKTSEGNLLPFNENGIPNDLGPNVSGSPADFFIAGDLRANEQVGLMTMHTLFVREHNRLVDQFNASGIFGNEAYEIARQLVGAFMQVITYKEFLPVLLGRNNDLAPYTVYNEAVDPNISTEFSTAAFRLGHSMLNPFLLRLDSLGNEIADGHLALRDSFFTPDRLVREGGLEPVLRGLAAQRAMDIDVQIVDDVRNFLFGPPGAGGFDLASLNIQRGRDHGLPRYNDAREAMGLPRVNSFNEMNATGATKRKLRMVYNSVDDVDLWVGGLAERHVQGGLVGELFHAIIKDQFTRLRDGDRFWYQRVFTGNTLQDIENTRLSHIIVRNTDIGQNEIARNVFRVAN